MEKPYYDHIILGWQLYLPSKDHSVKLAMSLFLASQVYNSGKVKKAMTTQVIPQDLVSLFYICQGLPSLGAVAQTVAPFSYLYHYHQSDEVKGR